MSIGIDIYEHIRYLHEHEGLSQREIAKTIGISRNTVRKYYNGVQLPWVRKGISGRKPYVITQEVIDFIKGCLEHDEIENIKKQKHTARRIFDRLVDERGFNGGESTIRGIVAELREKKTKVFVPLSFEPGEAAQIDWGTAKAYIADKQVVINYFCMRECYSANIFCIAFYRQNEESFLEGLINGFEYFGGVPRRIIFDNAKVAVKEGSGLNAKVQEKYKAFAAHYAFKCDFCNIAAGHEKGLIEGLVGWVRRNIFVPIPKVDTLDELNAQILKKCLQYGRNKIAGRVQSVGDMMNSARICMALLPPHGFDTSKAVTAKVDSYSTVRFDNNYYSVPANYTGKEMCIKGYSNEVAIIYQDTEIARHPRSYERGETKYRLDHYIDLIEKRPRSVFNAKPVRNNLSAELLDVGKRLSDNREMVKLLRLYIEHGEDKLVAAIGSIQHSEITVEKILIHLQNAGMPNRLK